VAVLSQSLGNLLKTIQNKDFDMAPRCADSKELLKTWYQVDGRAHPPCYGLQPKASHISRFKVWNKIYIFIQNRDNLIEVRGSIQAMALPPTRVPHFFFTFFSLTVMHEEVLDVMFGWRTLLSANK
jgi:hypothetical protein